MKKFITAIFISVGLVSSAQDVSVEKSVYGIQTGFLGIYIHNESRLARALALRSEIGFDSEFMSGAIPGKTGYLLTPVLTVEPRFYYNLNKRVLKSKDISNNSGNFITLKTSCHPNWFTLGNYAVVNNSTDFSMIPTWGLRRNIGTHFNYETGIGIGYRLYFSRYYSMASEAVANLHLRIGFVF